MINLIIILVVSAFFGALGGVAMYFLLKKEAEEKRNEEMKKELLFSITKKDFTIQTFRSGGKGGQHQNKTDSGVRIIHEESGARGECRNHRHQHRNKREALKRLTEDNKFKLWINRKALEVIEGKRLEERVDDMMKPENLKIEGKVDKEEGGCGVWCSCPECMP